MTLVEIIFMTGHEYYSYGTTTKQISHCLTKTYMFFSMPIQELITLINIIKNVLLEHQYVICSRGQLYGLDKIESLPDVPQISECKSNSELGSRIE